MSEAAAHNGVFPNAITTTLANGRTACDLALAAGHIEAAALL